MQNKNKIGFGILLILNLFIFSAAASAQNAENFVDIDGKLEVIHADDFQHPENSKYIFYLNVDGKRFELISDKQLPVVISGTPANVKGTLNGNKILVESLTIKQAAKETPALSQEEQNALAEGNEEAAISLGSKFSLSWAYLAVPVFLVVLFLAYIEIKRVNEHKQLMGSRQQQKILSLRNYASTNLRKGYSKEQIRNALIKNNYNNQEIEEAFKGIK